ncbi:MAG: hypothetical protein SFU25_08455 [Candidatus Caenarcaniphilales bacterium]|nr:hypothetical protein [Candidatus Caenarcaniphilales bacterium]
MLFCAHGYAGERASAGSTHGPELVGSSQKMIMHLIRAFGLQLEEATVPIHPEEISARPCFIDVDGSVFSTTQVIEALTPFEKHLEGLREQIKTNTKKFLHYDLMTIEELLNNFRDLDYWARRYLEVNCQAEKGVSISEQSALNLLNKIIPYWPGELYSHENLRIKNGGFPLLFQRLKQGLEKLGVQFKESHKLTKIEPWDGDRLALYFRDSEGDLLRYISSASILALPFYDLCKIEGLEKLLNPKIFQFISQLAGSGSDLTKIEISSIDGKPIGEHLNSVFVSGLDFNSEWWRVQETPYPDQSTIRGLIYGT